MLMDMFRELQAENFQLKKTVTQLQSKVHVLESGMEAGCKQL